MKKTLKLNAAAPERRVGIRELKSRLSECVREVKSGASIVVTERGHAVARLVPEIASDPQTVQQKVEVLRREGKILWNGRKLPPFRPVGKVRGNRTVSDILIEDRG
jgi:prevent-host-death family protein